jgi:AcrR family transcriptional regulator
MTRSTNLPRQRSRGRPLSGTDGDIRQDIIDSAVNHFASQGYAATSVREIAEDVGVNGAMIHYYFGNKEALLLAALEAVTAPFAAALAQMKQRGEAPLEELVEIIFDVFSQRPDLPVLMTREVLLPGGAAQQAFIEQLADRLGGAIPGLLAAEKAAGRLRADLDPASATLQLMSLCAFPFLSRGVVEPVLGLSYNADGMEHMKAQVTKLLRQGVLA